jgi:hypothetical protein
MQLFQQEIGLVTANALAERLSIWEHGPRGMSPATYYIDSARKINHDGDEE